MEKTKKTRKVIKIKKIIYYNNIPLRLREKFDDISGVNKNKFTIVESQGKYGLFNSKGKEVIPCKYEYISDFNQDKVAIVKLNSKYGLINVKGEKVTPCIYDDINDFNEYGITKVKFYEKYGLINTKGEEILPCEYDECCEWSKNGIFKVRLNDKYGLINNTGEMFADCLDYVSHFDENGLSFCIKGNQVFYLDMNLQPILIEKRVIDESNEPLEFALEKDFKNITITDNNTLIETNEDYGYMTITDDDILIETNEEYAKKLTKSPKKSKYPTN